MQRHQLHAFFASLRLAFAGLQRGVSQEGDQLGHALAVFIVRAGEARGDRHQFVQVLGTRFRIQPAAAFLGPMLAQARAHQHMVDAFGQFHLAGFGMQLADQAEEGGQGIACARGQRVLLRAQHRRFPQRQRTGTCQPAHLIQRPVANAARGRVDRAFERSVIAAIGQQAQVSQRVLDFGTFEETHAAIHAVRQLLGNQRFFQRARLRVAAVEHRHFAITAAVAHPLPCTLDHIARFVHFVVGRIQIDRVAIA